VISPPTQRPLPDNTQHNGQTSMPPARFEPAIPTNERPQTHAIDREATHTHTHTNLCLTNHKSTIPGHRLLIYATRSTSFAMAMKQANLPEFFLMTVLKDFIPDFTVVVQPRNIWNSVPITLHFVFFSLNQRCVRYLSLCNQDMYSGYASMSILRAESSI